MNAENPAANAGTTGMADDERPDLSNSNVREDLAMTGRCALVHLPTGRTCLLPLRHQGPCEFHRPQEAQDMVPGS
ncbi:hypothetical protein [Pseudarthrobacter enclensis]|uniref:Uncharacterized protein n=1 Tax=Pseudarthrobacter enclensis TaxID=993070 RepID=A0ABT9RS54_9MICC|nr:hypothetical protein [Pseudarthrobacter enclensis]MDP9887590.1 hypothetical protein [Pseudarthrobacter enclensis]